MSNSVRPHRRQPTRLRRPWDSPGKNTGVGCHFLLQCMKVKSEVAQSCLTPSDSMDCSPPGSSVRGIFQARVLEWGAIAFSMVFFHKSSDEKSSCFWDQSRLTSLLYLTQWSPSVFFNTPQYSPPRQSAPLPHALGYALQSFLCSLLDFYLFLNPTQSLDWDRIHNYHSQVDNKNKNCIWWSEENLEWRSLCPNWGTQNSTKNFTFFFF